MMNYAVVALVIALALVVIVWWPRPAGGDPSSCDAVAQAERDRVVTACDEQRKLLSEIMNLEHLE